MDFRSSSVSLEASAGLSQLYSFLREVIWMQGHFLFFVLTWESRQRWQPLKLVQVPLSTQVQKGQTRNKTWWKLGTNPKVKVVILRIMMTIKPLFCTRQGDRYFSHIILSPVWKALLSLFCSMRIWGSGNLFKFCKIQDSNAHLLWCQILCRVQHHVAPLQGPDKTVCEEGTEVFT